MGWVGDLLEERRRRVLRFVESYRDGAGELPSAAIVAGRLGVSVGVASTALRALRRAGAL